MPRPFVLLLSEPDEELREAIEAALGGEGTVHSPPAEYGIDQVKLILDILADGAAITAGAAGVVQVLIRVREVVRKRKKRVRFKVLGGGEEVVLTEVSEEELRRLAEKSLQ